MSEITLAEVARRLERIEGKIDAADAKHVTRAEYQADERAQAERDKSHSRRLDRVEAGQAWLMRALAGLAFALLVQIVVVIVAGVAG